MRFLREKVRSPDPKVDRRFSSSVFILLNWVPYFSLPCRGHGELGNRSRQHNGGTGGVLRRVFAFPDGNHGPAAKLKTLALIEPSPMNLTASSVLAVRLSSIC